MAAVWRQLARVLLVVLTVGIAIVGGRAFFGRMGGGEVTTGRPPSLASAPPGPVAAAPPAERTPVELRPPEAPDRPAPPLRPVAAARPVAALGPAALVAPGGPAPLRVQPPRSPGRPALARRLGPLLSRVIGVRPLIRLSRNGRPAATLMAARGHAEARPRARRPASTS